MSRKPTKERMVTFQISFPISLLEQTDKAVEDRGFNSRAEIIRQCTRSGLANLEKTEPSSKNG